MSNDLFKYVFQNESNLYGSARFMNFWERRKFLSKNNEGVVIDGVNKLPLDLSYQGVLVLAPTGMGKSTSYILPNIYAAKNQSLVVTDPSGDLLELTRGYLENKMGYRIQVINPNNLSVSGRFNPLERVNDYTEAQKTASILVDSAFPKSGSNDSFWNESAVDLLSVLIKGIMVSPQENRTLKFLLQLLEKFNAEQEFVNEFMASHLDEDGYLQLRSFLGQEERMRNSVLSTAKTALRSMHDPKMAELTSSHTIDFESLRNERSALFIQVPETELKYYRFVLSLLYCQLMTFALSADPLETNLRPIFFLLDEAGHIKISNPSLATVATTIRRKKCSLSIVIQDLSQLYHLYGEEANAILRGGLVNHLYFGGLNHDTCLQIEKTLGAKTVSYKEKGFSSSNKFGGSRYSRMAQPLLSADEIRRLSSEAILISSNKYPLRLNLRPWYAQKSLIKKSKL